MPAGNHQLVRLIQASLNSWTHAPLQDAEIEPGKTTTVDINIEGVRIVGHISAPAGVDMSKFQKGASLQSATPFRIKPGVSQAQIETMIADPGFQEAMKRVRYFAAVLKSDGSILAEDVPPGSYDLNLYASVPRDGKPDQLYMALQSFSVPEGADNGSTINIGELQFVPQPRP